MKKLLSLCLILALATALSGCFKVDIDLPVNAVPTSEAPATAAPVEPSTLAPVTEIPTTLPVITEPVSTTEYHDDYDLPAYTVPVTTTEPAPKALSDMSQDEVIAYFNKTLNTVKSQSVGFKKSKLTSILDLKLSNSMANSLVSFVKGALLSDTAEETVVNKGESSVDVMSPSGAAYASDIASADVSSVKVTKSGENYVITVNMKDMTNPDKASSYGKLFDFITVDDVVNTYAPKVGATVAKENIEVVFSGCYAELTVDANDGIVKYTTFVKGIMNMKDASIKKVVTINTDLAVTLGSTTDYTNFVY